jgi:hypothetical protein
MIPLRLAKAVRPKRGTWVMHPMSTHPHEVTAFSGRGVELTRYGKRGDRDVFIADPVHVPHLEPADESLVRLGKRRKNRVMRMGKAEVPLWLGGWSRLGPGVLMKAYRPAPHPRYQRPPSESIVRRMIAKGWRAARHIETADKHVALAEEIRTRLESGGAFRRSARMLQTDALAHQRQASWHYAAAMLYQDIMSRGPRRA